jgi:hypothetical protein
MAVGLSGAADRVSTGIAAMSAIARMEVANREP